MPYTVLEHTADVRLLVEGRTLAELFAEALRGMMELMKPEGWREEAKAPGGPAEKSRHIQLEAPSATVNSRPR